MKQKTFLQITGIFFLVAAIIHALRLVFGWQAILGTYTVPVWVSMVGVLVAGYLAYTAFRQIK